jgi:ELWxxDGT repeat protein
MAVLGNSLYFMSYDPTNSDGQSTGELWKTDGTVAGTQLVADVNSGSDAGDGASPEPSDLINVNGELYFAADDGVHGWELWKSDGTAGGTSMVDDLAPPPPEAGYPEDGSYPSDLIDVNEMLYFTATPDYSASELYSLDPTSGLPVVVDPITNGGPSDPQQLVAAGDGLFFTASDGSGGNSLWYSDGTSTGTSQIADINPGGESNITAMTAIGSTLYFTADDGTHGAELWSSDGTAAGTTLAADVQPGSEGSSPGPVTEFQGKLLFGAGVDGYGQEPFVLTLPAPSAPVASLAPPFASGVSNDPMPVVTGTAPAGSTVYMFADGVAVGSTVTSTDGQFQVGSSVALADGTHELTLSDEMNGVTSAATSPLTFIVDTKHPTVALVSTTASSIELQFSENVAANFGRGDFTITDIDTGKRISKADVRVSYNTRNNTATIFFKGIRSDALGTGHYRLRIAASKITDAAGNDLSSDESFGFTIRKKR